MLRVFIMCANGPAVIISKRYSPPVKVAGALLVKIVQVEKSGEYGVVFAIQVQIFMNIRRVAVQS
jgi:hypothetical protein